MADPGAISAAFRVELPLLFPQTENFDAAGRTVASIGPIAAFGVDLCRVRSCSVDLKSAQGQNRKYSRRADVFRSTPKTGHRSMRSACPFRASSGHSPHPESEPTVAEESVADVA
jgi:hypothetical protein